jgi:hypothetical protein
MRCIEFMGNHEYCGNCGESDFHYGRPCDPARVAIREARDKERKLKTERCLEKAKELLDKASIPYRVEYPYGPKTPIVTIDIYKLD